jgi:hypothetical protein
MLSRLPILHQTLLRQIDQQAALLGFPAYLVGGGVRDILLNLPALDLDIVIEGDAIQLAHALKDRHGGALTLHAKFRTATWQPPEGPPLDLITARRETYRAPASLPDVSPSNLADDLARRDFSINTLALRLADEALLDLHNAQSDLANGLIRVLHPQSFRDDPTRLYRAVRYETRYGFRLAPDTLALISPALPLVERLTAERLRHELDLVFNETRPARVLARMDELGLLQAVLPNVLPWDSDIAKRLDSALSTPPAPGWGLGLTFNGQPLNQVLGYALWFAGLNHSQIALLQVRLTFPPGRFQNSPGRLRPAGRFARPGRFQTLGLGAAAGRSAPARPLRRPPHQRRRSPQTLRHALAAHPPPNRRRRPQSPRPAPRPALRPNPLATPRRLAGRGNQHAGTRTNLVKIKRSKLMAMSTNLPWFGGHS